MQRTNPETASDDDEPAPPAGYAVRHATREDFDRVLALIQAADLVDFGEHVFQAEFLEHDWSFPELDPARDTWLVERDGPACAYAWLLARDDHRELDGWGVIHPEHRGRGVGSFLMDLVERRASEHASLALAKGGALLRWGVIATDAAVHDLLERRGFAVERHMWEMEMELGGRIGEPEPPVGVVIRRFDPDGDARAVHAVIQDAFVGHYGWVRRTFEEWSATNLEPARADPSLWWVAVADGGEVVGAAVCSGADPMGFVGSLAVLPDHQGRGIGAALLRSSFGEFAARGMSKVSLDVDSQNATGAVELYEKVGMHAARQFDVFVKRFEPA